MSNFVARACSRTTVRLAACLSVFIIAALGGEAQAKRPGNRYCYGGVCHRVMTLAQTQAMTGKVVRLAASHYGDCRYDRYNPCGLTSSGEEFHPERPDNAASAIHPDGTILILRSPITRRTAVVRVNNLGPFMGNRKLDVSRATARKLGFEHRGVAGLDVMVVYTPTPAETRYVRRRRYAPVAGYLGHTPSMAHAFLAYADISEKQRFDRLAAKACRLARKIRRWRSPIRLALLHIPPPLPRRARPHA